MKRIALAAISTLAALVALFSYPTSTGQSGAAVAQAVSSAKILTQPGTTSATTTGQGPDPAGGATSTGSASGGSGQQPSSGSTLASPSLSPSPSPSPSLSPSLSLSSSNAAPSTPDSTTSRRAATGSVTVDGAAEMTNYGAVQVRVVIANGAITDVIAVDYPQQDRTDREINSQAIPMLRSQALSAQSAKIDGVSGATFTTEGYVASLQSALDAAGFGK